MIGYFDVTEFPSQFETLPSAEHVAIEWPDVIRAYAGELLVTGDKRRVKYLVPCRLQEAAYSKKTAKRQARFGLLSGKQRSSEHATEARLLVFDFDGLKRAQMAGIFAELRWLACLVYSSYSHGNPDKAGARFRVVIALDRLVTVCEYPVLWDQLNFQKFGQLADKSSRQMYQQQGAWATNHAWANKAFKAIGNGSELSVDYWLNQISKVDRNHTAHSFNLGSEEIRRIRLALRWIDFSSHDSWITAGSALKVLDDEVFKEDWLRISVPSEDPRYNPETVWHSLRPHMPPKAAYPKLLGMARDGATAIVEKCRGLDLLSAEADAAAAYLVTYHHTHWLKLKGGQ